MGTLDCILIGVGIWLLAALVVITWVARTTREFPEGHIFVTCEAPGCHKRPPPGSPICDDCREEKTLAAG